MLDLGELPTFDLGQARTDLVVRGVDRRIRVVAVADRFGRLAEAAHVLGEDPP
jgi:hypothetical protein